MTKTKAVIFDLDGVVVDTAKFHFLAWRELALDLGFVFTEKENEKLKGISRVNSLDLILTWAKVSITKEEKERLLIKKNTVYLSYINELTQQDILPGIIEILTQLKIKDLKTAIGSASKNARFILEKLNIINAFDIVVDGTNVEKSKPDPEVFTRCADLLKVNNIECLVIEDAEAGIEAAQRVGMKTIGIGSSKELNKADYQFAQLNVISNKLLTKILAQ